MRKTFQDRELSHLIVCGIPLRDEPHSNLDIRIGFPIYDGQCYSSAVFIQGVLKQDIYAESALSALANAFNLLDKTINPPIPLLLKIANLEADDIPEVTINIEVL